MPPSSSPGPLKLPSQLIPPKHLVLRIELSLQPFQICTAGVLSGSTIFFNHACPLGLPIAHIAHGGQCSLACLHAEERHVGAVEAGCNRDAPHDDDDIDQSGSHWIFNVLLAPMEYGLVVATTQYALH